LLSSAVEMGLDLLEKQGSFLPYCMAVNDAGETFIYSPASGSAKANRPPSGTSRTGWKATRRRCWSITPMKPERTCSQRPNARSNRIAVLRHPSRISGLSRQTLRPSRTEVSSRLARRRIRREHGVDDSCAVPGRARNFAVVRTCCVTGIRT
jgi:hypothetical protein